MSIQNTAVLVSVSTKYPTLTMKQKQLEQHLDDKQRAGSKVHTASKKLFSGWAKLKEVKKLQNQATTNTRDASFPWAHGIGIVHVKMLSDIRSKFNDLKDEHDKLVEGLRADYQHQIDRDKVALGDSFDAMNYPDVDTFIDKINLSFDTWPVPSSDFRVEISEAERELIAQEIEAKTADVLENTEKMLWERLSKACDVFMQTYDEREGKNAYQSSLQHFKDLVENLPNLNMNNQEAFHPIREQLKKALDGVDIETLKNDSATREQATNEVAKVQSQIAGIL